MSLAHRASWKHNSLARWQNQLAPGYRTLLSLICTLGGAYTWRGLFLEFYGIIFFRLLMETGPPLYMVIRATQRSRLTCTAKGVTSFVSYFKTLSNGPALGIEPTTSRSAVKRSTDWTNPAVVERLNKFYTFQRSTSVYSVSGIFLLYHFLYKWWEFVAGKLKGQVIRATFSHNLSRNIVALQVEKGCCPYYHLRSQLVTQQILMLQVGAL